MNGTNDEKSIPLHNRLGFQIALPFAFFIVVVLAVLFGGAYFTYTQESAQSLLIPRTVVRTTGESIASFFNYLELDLNLAAENIGPTLALTPGNGLFLRNLIRNSRAVIELDFFNLNGQGLFTVSNPTVKTLASPAPIHDDPYFASTVARGIDFIADPGLSSGGSPYVFWYFPVRDPVGRVIGVMRAMIDISSLWDFLAENPPQMPAGDVYIVDGHGTFLIANRAHSLAGTSLASNEGVNAFLHGDDSLHFYTGISGSAVAGAAVALPPTPWGLVVESPQSAFAATTEEAVIVFLILFAVLVTLVFYEFFIVRRELLSPLGLLINKIGEFGAGNYKARVRIPVSNELNFLAFVFNGMAENIDRETSSIVEELKRVVSEQDISAKLLVRRDLELSKANDKLRDVGRMKSEFVSVVAHQLRTPLSAIKWIFKMIADGDAGPVDAELKGMALKGYESNERLIALVNDLLDIDRLESGTVQFSFHPIDLKALIENLLIELAPRASVKNVTVKLVPFELPKVRADQVKLRAVLQNIIENGIKYTRDNGSVTIEVKEAEGKALISVTDSGIGIPEDQQKQIFSKFFRGRNAQREVAEGTGLGLSLAKNIVERHGGSIWFESAEGKGTTFRFTIPLA